MDDSNPVDVYFYLSFLEGQVFEFYLEKFLKTFCSCFLARRATWGETWEVTETERRSREN